MAGIISRIQSIINGALPTDSSAQVRLAGTAIPIDPFLVGRTRFAKKIGDTMAIMVSNNSTTLSTAVAINSNTLILAEVIEPYIVLGSKLLINDVELVTVDDVIEVNIPANTMTIRIVEKFKASHDAGVKVVLFGHPIQVNTDSIPVTDISSYIVEKGSIPLTLPHTVQLRYRNLTSIADVTCTGVSQATYTPVSTTPTTGQVQVDIANGLLIFNAAQAGDTVTVTYRYNIVVSTALSITSNSISTSSGYVRIPIYATDSISIGYTSYKIKSIVSSLSFTLDNNGNIVQVAPNTPITTNIVKTEYQILVEPLPVTIKQGDTIHLRAFPAYESKILQIPQYPFTQDNLGPFCLDWLSGVTTENTSVNETMVVKLYDQGTIDVNGNPVPVITETIDKNFLVLREPIQADAMLYWDLLRGKINWNGRETLAFVDQDPQLPAFLIHYFAVPEFPSGQFNSYRLRVVNENTNAAKITITMDPSAALNFVVLGNSTSYLDIPITETVKRIYLGAIPLKSDNVTPGGTLIKPLRFGDWSVDNSPITAIQYTLVVDTDIRYRWGTTGMFVKPLMLSNNYLQARLDIGSGVNNGRLLL